MAGSLAWLGNAGRAGWPAQPPAGREYRSGEVRGPVLATMALFRESSRLRAAAALLLNLVAGVAEVFLIVGFWAAATRWS